MKELSIEEKAKRYDEALQKAKSVIEQKPLMEYLKKGIEYIFPELKESEDERTRKEIIDFATKANNGFTSILANNYNFNKWLAWLEKQGEQKTTIEMKTPEESLGIDSDTYNKIVDECIYGEQKPIKEHNACEFCEDRYGCVNPCSMKLIEEEKYTDNVEPKFHEGDWVVDNCGNVCKIEGILNQFYILEWVEGGESRPTIEWVDKTFHLWTIQDAKDGDVLCYKDEISLYKHDIKNCTKQEATFGGFVYHCCYDGKRFIMDSLYSLTEQDKMDIHPATKEQRDLLFQKMKEAGYEWDADEKELKEIEQKSAWSEEDERLRTSCIKHIEEELERIRNDKYGHSEIISDLKESCRERINWLKSIKDRYTWKPSEEQIKALTHLFDGHLVGAKLIPKDYDNLRLLLEQLKKLKS